MNIYPLFSYLSLISLLLLQLNAIVYEDAEDLTTKGWTIVKSPYVEKIENIFDKEKSSRVIKLFGNKTRSIYLLNIDQNISKFDTSKSLFEWEMNYLEEFVVIIKLETHNGVRHLLYTSGSRDSYLQYGLNYPKDGKWKKFTRNLEKDLQHFEKNNYIEKIKSFVVKGSGLVDNIELKEFKKIKITPPKVVKKIPKKELKNYKKDTLPIIKLKGSNPLFLDIGEEYVEYGAIAKNPDGSEINVVIIQSIDILKEGEYVVMYMATNKLGNITMDKRRVIVGNFPTSKKGKKIAKLKKEEKRVEQEPELPTPNEEELFSSEEYIYLKEKDARPSRPGL